MTAILEREIKLRFETPEAARTAILRAGATPVRCRRLQEDCLLDTADETLRRHRCVLRVRVESGRSVLTYKGPVPPSLVKAREEMETIVADGEGLVAILQQLGFQTWFRYQKYREEFALDDVIVTVDETPVGTFVEIEGGERGIAAIASMLGRSPADYVLDSYRGLFIRHCEDHGLPPTDMLFDDE